jgi:hypothetical protein
MKFVASNVVKTTKRMNVPRSEISLAKYTLRISDHTANFKGCPTFKSADKNIASKIHYSLKTLKKKIN